MNVVTDIYMEVPTEARRKCVITQKCSNQGGCLADGRCAVPFCEPGYSSACPCIDVKNLLKKSSQFDADTGELVCNGTCAELYKVQVFC